MTALDTRPAPADVPPAPTATAAPGTGFRRRSAAVAAAGAGLLTFAGFAATPWEGEQDTAKYLEALAANELQAQIAATLLHFGFLLMVPAVLALGRMVRHRATVLGNVGMAIGLLGTIGLPGLLVVDWYGLELAKNLPIDQAVQIEEATQSHALGMLLAVPSGLGMVLGFTLLFVAAARARQLPWLVAPLVPAGFVVASTPALPQVLVGSGLIAVALIAVAVRTWRMTDTEWETGRAV